MGQRSYAYGRVEVSGEGAIFTDPNTGEEKSIQFSKALEGNLKNIFDDALRNPVLVVFERVIWDGEELAILVAVFVNPSEDTMRIIKKTSQESDGKFFRFYGAVWFQQ